ncbi:ATP-dependent DNA helicase RecG [bacterium]|nr:ATP-dependent DNA helicase RecG [bacterium]
MKRPARDAGADGVAGNRSNARRVRLSDIKGVGPAIAAKLRDAGFQTPQQLLHIVPRRYVDFRRVVSVSDLNPGEPAALDVLAQGVRRLRAWRGRAFAEAIVEDKTGTLRVRLFGPPARGADVAFRKGRRLFLCGVPENAGDEIILTQPRVTAVRDGDGPANAARVEPIYPPIGDLPPGRVARIVKAAIDLVERKLVDGLPDDDAICAAWPPLSAALRAIHDPPAEADVDALNAGASIAQRRMIFDELFFIQLGLLRRRAVSMNESAPRLRDRREREIAARAAMPFALTAAQERALEDIRADMLAARPMHRLVQGDVGSGKTIVAFFAALLAIENGMTAAIMAPTDILARQHAESLSKLTGACGVRLARVGALARGAEQKEVRERIESGEVDLIVGTHALITKSVRIPRLGLVVVDEQHRFGVRHRGALAAKGDAPHVLVMSATPIPRSLAMTIYGDLDITLIRERPPGRRPPDTRWIRGGEQAAWRLVSDEIERGGRAFIVCPLIEESESIAAVSATRRFEALRKGPLSGVRLAIVHGRVPLAEREAILTGLAADEFDAVVASTVVEVGIDVPQATIIVIDNADRFGLTQLHQLRGRVGRGDRPGMCVLLTGETVTPAAAERLAALVETDDGFVLAEKDLAMRGPGDILGARQHGLPALRFACLARDVEILDQARGAARRLLQRDPDLAAHPGTARILAHRWSSRLELETFG